MSNNGKATPLQREKFRKFVERSGIMELVTRALVDLYEERLTDPDRAMEFFRARINAPAVKETEPTETPPAQDTPTPC